MSSAILALQQAPLLAQQLPLVIANIQAFGPPVLTALVLNSMNPNWLSELIESSHSVVKMSFNYFKKVFYSYRLIYKIYNNANLKQSQTEQENYKDKCHSFLEVDPVFKNKKHFKIFIKDDIVNPDIIKQANDQYSEHGDITFEQVDNIADADVVFTETEGAPESSESTVILGLSNFFYKAVNKEEKTFLASITDVTKIYEALAMNADYNKGDYSEFTKKIINSLYDLLNNIDKDDANHETIRTQTRERFPENTDAQLNNYEPLHTTIHEMAHLFQGGYHPHDLSTMNPFHFNRVLDLKNELDHQSTTVLSYKGNHENDNAVLKICDAVNIAYRFGPNLSKKGQTISFDLFEKTERKHFDNNFRDIVLTTKGGDGIFNATNLTDKNTHSASFSMDEGFLPTRIHRYPELGESNVVSLYNGPNTKIKTLNCGNARNRIYLTGSHFKTINLSAEIRTSIYESSTITILGDNPCDTVINNFNPKVDTLEIRNFGNNYQDYISKNEMDEFIQYNNYRPERFNQVYYHNYDKTTTAGMKAFEQSYKDKYELTEQTIDGHKSTVLQFSDRKIVLNNVPLEKFKKHLAERIMPRSDGLPRTPLIRHNVFELKLNTFEDYNRTNNYQQNSIVGVTSLLAIALQFRMFTPHNLLKKGIINYENKSKLLYPAIFAWNQSLKLANAALITALSITSATAFSLIILYTDIKKQPLLSMIFKPLFFTAKYIFKAMSYCLRPLTRKITNKVSEQYEKYYGDEKVKIKTKHKHYTPGYKTKSERRKLRSAHRSVVRRRDKRRQGFK